MASLARVVFGSSALKWNKNLVNYPFAPGFCSMYIVPCCYSSSLPVSSVITHHHTTDQAEDTDDKSPNHRNRPVED